MREVLFRGKSTDNGEWVYGVPVIAKDIISDKDITVMVDNPNEIVPMEGLPLFEQIDPVTVGQFAGLTDKNGKKIFEGDIVSTVDGNYLIFCDDYTGLHFEMRRELTGGYIKLESLSFYELEVIGNIHDNSELLEVTE